MPNGDKAKDLMQVAMEHGLSIDWQVKDGASGPYYRAIVRGNGRMECTMAHTPAEMVQSVSMVLEDDFGIAGHLDDLGAP